MSNPQRATPTDRPSRTKARRWPGPVIAALLLLSLAGASWSLIQLSSMGDSVAYTRDVQLAISRVVSTIVDAETGQRGYLASGDAEFLDTYERGRAHWRADFDHLATLINDNPQQQARLAQLATLIGDKLTELASTRAARDRGVRDHALDALMLSGKNTMGEIRAVGGQMLDEEERLYAEREHERSVRSTITAVGFVVGTIVFAVVLITLWTQRKRAAERAERLEIAIELEQQLATTHAELAALVENAPIGLTLLDRELRYRHVNRTLAEGIDGVAVVDHLGKRPAEVIPESSDLTERLQRVLDTSVSEEADLAVPPNADTEARTYRAVYFPVRDAAGTATGVGIAMRDVTVAREAERVRDLLLAQVAAQRAKLRSLIMQTPVPIAVFEGPDARYELVNEAYAALVGGRGDLVGRPLLDVFPALHEHPSYAAVAETFRTGEPRTLTEVLTPMARDGVADARYFTVSHGALRDETGQVSEVAAVGVEVTEQVRARQALERSVRFAEQFVGMLGHDLRNPLNAIEMAASMLKRKLDGQADITLVERVIRSGRRMSNMVDQLLDLTRARLGGGIAITRKPVMLADVISAIVEELRLVYPDRQIVCEIDAAISGDWDEERLGQIVSNLVGNALQYSDAARAVTVTAGTHDGDAWFEVRNYGTPMSPDLLAVMFEPYHGTRVREAKTRGLGLGLYITQQIVAAHDGRIEVESTAEHGTAFKITLPKATSQPTTVQERPRFVS